jgi:hypothetical protein
MEILTGARCLYRSRGLRQIRPAILLCFAVAFANLAAGAAEEPLDEYQVKAAFLFNFAKFVEWPSGTFNTPDQPITICILGKDPFGHSLDDTVAGRLVDGRSFVVRRISGVRQVPGCHILFVSSADDMRPAATLADIGTPGVLTVGESDAAGADGFVINFRLEDGKVRFDINVGTANREKLRISSRLLGLAHIVRTARK